MHSRKPAMILLYPSRIGFSRTPRSNPVMMLSSATDGPVYLWNVPHICSWRIPNLSKTFVGPCLSLLKGVVASNSEQSYIYRNQWCWWGKTLNILSLGWFQCIFNAYLKQKTTIISKSLNSLYNFSFCFYYYNNLFL